MSERDSWVASVHREAQVTTFACGSFLKMNEPSGHRGDQCLPLPIILAN